MFSTNFNVKLISNRFWSLPRPSQLILSPFASIPSWIQTSWIAFWFCSSTDTVVAASRLAGMGTAVMIGATEEVRVKTDRIRPYTFNCCGGTVVRINKRVRLFYVRCACGMWSVYMLAASDRSVAFSTYSMSVLYLEREKHFGICCCCRQSMGALKLLSHTYGNSTAAFTSRTLAVLTRSVFHFASLSSWPTTISNGTEIYIYIISLPMQRQWQRTCHSMRMRCASIERQLPFFPPSAIPLCQSVSPTTFAVAFFFSCVTNFISIVRTIKNKMLIKFFNWFKVSFHLWKI